MLTTGFLCDISMPTVRMCSRHDGGCKPEGWVRGEVRQQAALGSRLALMSCSAPGAGRQAQSLELAAPATLLITDHNSYVFADQAGP